MEKFNVRVHSYRKICEPVRPVSAIHPVCRKRPGSLIQSGGPLFLHRALARRAFGRSQVGLLEHRRLRILHLKRSGRHLHAHAVLVGQFRWYPPRVPAGETSAIFKVACGDNLACGSVMVMVGRSGRLPLTSRLLTFSPSAPTIANER